MNAVDFSYMILMACHFGITRHYHEQNNIEPTHVFIAMDERLICQVLCKYISNALLINSLIKMKLTCKERLCFDILIIQVNVDCKLTYDQNQKGYVQNHVVIFH